MQPPVRRERGTRVDRGPPPEVGEPSARLLDDDLRSGEVPGLEVELRVDLGLACRDEPVAQVVAEAPLALRRVDEPGEAVPVATLPDDAQPRVHEEAPAELAHVRDPEALAVPVRPRTPTGGIDLGRHRVMDDAHRDFATLLQCDQRRPEPDAADEVLRAVDRVDDPAHLVRSVPAELLAEGAVRREGASEDLDDRLLGFAVGPGDRCGVGLERDFDALVEVLERDLPRGTRRVHGRVERAVTHFGSSAGKGSPRSASTLA